MNKYPLKKQITTTLNRLKKRWPEPGAMEIGSAYQSLVAVALSARTRDEQVLLLLPEFFKAFPSTKELSVATEAVIRSKINTIGMFRQKAKNLKRMAIRVEEVYGGKIPDTMEDLITLGGVGRKTASVVLPYIYDKPAIAVDTHVHRVTNRLGWVNTKTPDKTEEKLLDLIPKSQMKKVNQVFVKHGRYLCIKNPRCWACPVADICAFKNKNLTTPKNAQKILDNIQTREDRLQDLRQNIL
jgi:endonuclease-3